MVSKGVPQSRSIMKKHAHFLFIIFCQDIFKTSCWQIFFKVIILRILGKSIIYTVNDIIVTLYYKTLRFHQWFFNYGLNDDVDEKTN